MVTISELAKLADVSKSTISKALNGQPGVGEDTRQRILKLAEQHNYSPNAFGKGLKSKRSGNIGVIFCREQQPLSGNPFYSRVLEGLEAELAYNNYNLVLQLIPQNSPPELPKMVKEHSVDGLILVGVLDLKLVERIIDTEIPVILVDPKVSFNQCSQVVIDNENGAFKAVNYLIEHGNREIGFVSGELSRLSFKQRFDGYKKALEFSKIPLRDKWIKSGGIESGYTFVQELLELEETPTAIFAANDNNAFFGAKAIRYAGLQTPDDISIVGFDDVDLARFSYPPLTTIRVYKEELGSLAVRNLIKHLQGSQKEPVTTVVPVKLIERDSVKTIEPVRAAPAETAH